MITVCYEIGIILPPRGMSMHLESAMFYVWCGCGWQENSTSSMRCVDMLEAHDAKCQYRGDLSGQIKSHWWTRRSYVDADKARHLEIWLHPDYREWTWVLTTEDWKTFSGERMLKRLESGMVELKMLVDSSGLEAKVSIATDATKQVAQHYRRFP